MNGHDLDTVQLEAIEAGAENLEESNEGLKIYCVPSNLQDVTKRLKELDISAEGELTMVPKSSVSLESKEREDVENLIDALENNDDVEAVFSNIEELPLETLSEEKSN